MNQDNLDNYYFKSRDLLDAHYNNLERGPLKSGGGEDTLDLSHVPVILQFMLGVDFYYEMEGADNLELHETDITMNVFMTDSGLAVTTGEFFAAYGELQNFVSSIVDLNEGIIYKGAVTNFTDVMNGEATMHITAVTIDIGYPFNLEEFFFPTFAGGLLGYCDNSASGFDAATFINTVVNNSYPSSMFNKDYNCNFPALYHGFLDLQIYPSQLAWGGSNSFIWQNCANIFPKMYTGDVDACLSNQDINTYIDYLKDLIDWGLQNPDPTTSPSGFFPNTKFVGTIWHSHFSPPSTFGYPIPDFANACFGEFGVQCYHGGRLVYGDPLCPPPSPNHPGPISPGPGY
jgi:hypothetical protein